MATMGTTQSESLNQIRHQVAKRRKYKALVDEQEDRLSAMSENSFDSNDSQIQRMLKMREEDIKIDKELNHEAEEANRKNGNLAQQLHKF
mmetsp:Transcript_6322/g.7509  ORF Transcript_6322/g.7509 Transcript_6322/m.7509 type:complete len:90 (+) Transcript_6322:308-577(+)|eukprot:CAMPEP_0170455140 /NCGR_PEP_ID=MMETSP0123-20130129/3181_1 /TAXON_ID=182087 /ORGANISM="Favella ehrenbergii, Strain Fehren 1" /LENGTH=89 /DNA_ID=CAMNT_0010718133 /DNA_START=1132 /DNA_END=1401 /DNA_ORIENTATION=-